LPDAGRRGHLTLHLRRRRVERRRGHGSERALGPFGVRRALGAPERVADAARGVLRGRRARPEPWRRAGCVVSGVDVGFHVHAQPLGVARVAAGWMPRADQTRCYVEAVSLLALSNEPGWN